ncbi:MAG: CPBP family glutamic-type intramembrane protease [Terriglobales bacterium]
MSTNPQIDAALPADPPPPPPTRQAVAPAWHTIVFLVIVAAAAGFSAQQHGTGMIRNGRTFTYLFTIGWEWLLVAYIAWGIRKKQLKLRDLVGGKWKSPEDALLDVAVAVGYWIVASLILAAVAYAIGLAQPGHMAEAQKRIAPLKPVGALESVLWVALAATAGFCEEVMFRGYFMSQLRAWSGSALIAVIGQAVIFGAAHAYQGGRLIWVIMTYGLLFGILAWWRRSLRPGMMAHAMQDTLAGLIRNIPVR